jgi:hypothetical protein
VITTEDNYGCIARTLAEETGSERSMKALNGAELALGFYMYGGRVILL